MAVADRFAEHDDVGNDVVVFESPEVRARPAVTGLYFIGNANTARSAHRFISISEEIGGKHDLSGHTRHRLRDKSAQISSVFVQPRHDLIDLLRVAPTYFMHPRLWSTPARPVVFVRTEIDQRRSVPVIRMFE